MKKFLFLSITMLLAFSFTASAKTKLPYKSKSQNYGYALGMNISQQIASDIKKQKLPLNKAAISRGFQDGLNNKTKITVAQKNQLMKELTTNIRKQLAAQAKKVASQNAKKGAAFLAKNKKAKGVITTKSGLQYKILHKGTGTSPTIKDTVTVDYEGKLINNAVFDSSYKRHTPATFGVGSVIPGWTEALQKMKRGSKWQLFIPSSLGYGARGAGANIPPNSTLIFTVELKKITPAKTKK